MPTEYLPEELRKYFHFPDTKPCVAPNSLGWFDPRNAEILKQNMTDKTAFIVEIGSYFGLSTRYILDNAPNATVIAIDTWLGSVNEFIIGCKEWIDYDKILYDTFLVSCWDYRDRLIPLRMDSINGLRIVNQFCITPELIYVDGSHDIAQVYADLTTMVELFPKAKIVGDDWGWESVRGAVEKYALEHERLIRSNHSVWWFDD